MTDKEDLTMKNEEMRAKVSMFEQQLGSLREEVQSSKEQMQREQEKAALAIEKANRRRPAVGGIRSATQAGSSGAAGSAKKGGLKFNRPSQNQEAAQQNASTSQSTDQTQQMLIKQDPANRSLLNDN